MTTPRVDFVTLADDVAVAVSTVTVTPNRITMSPGRTKIEVQAVALTAGGAAVAGASLVLEALLQGPSTLTRQNWYKFGFMELRPDGQLATKEFDLLSLGFGLDTNLGMSVRGQMQGGANGASFTIVARAVG